MRWTKILILATVVVLFAYGSSYGCECQTLTTEDSFRSADSVFMGRVISIEPSGLCNKVTFDVSRSLKGDVENTISLYQAPLHRDVQFELDGRYLVFANTVEGRPSASSCSATRLLNSTRSPRGWMRGQQRFGRFENSRLRQFSYSEIALITAICVTLSMSSGFFVTRVWRRRK